MNYLSEQNIRRVKLSGRYKRALTERHTQTDTDIRGRWTIGKAISSVHAAAFTIRNKCKKPRFIHKLTASDTSKTAKITKKVITHQHIA